MPSDFESKLFRLVRLLVYQLEDGSDYKAYDYGTGHDVPKRRNRQKKDQRTSDREQQPGKITSHRQLVHRNAAVWRFAFHNLILPTSIMLPDVQRTPISHRVTALLGFQFLN